MNNLLVPVASALALAMVPASQAQFNAPPPTREQIEADWLRQDAKRLQPATDAKVTREADAAGAVDGVKDGKWGFHTEREREPWWQVDLGHVLPLQRVVLYNRCDGGFAARNARIRVLVSSDGKTFEQAYQHDGTVFLGFTDQKPLRVDLRGRPARFLRLALPGTDYFHLDEVEVYPVGGSNNIALGRPATQSSVSQWSVNHGQPGRERPREYPIALTVQRGLKLAESQKRLGQRVDEAVAKLQQVADEMNRLPAEVGEETKRALYFRARWAVRELALANPLLSFDSILFVKRAPTLFPHISDQHYGWWARGGGGLYLLRHFKQAGGPSSRRPTNLDAANSGTHGVRPSEKPAPQVVCLTADMPPGNFIGPDISYDGRKVLFAYARFYPELHQEKNKATKANVPEDAFYQVFEMNVDGTGRRQLTRGRYDDFEARYLPNGDILFLSTRKGLALQASAGFSESTLDADLPDSYVRCGGDNWRPVPVFTMHAMDAEGRNLRPLSAFENFEWAPSVADDGRILYTRWDYIDRFNGHFFSLWSANQDGTNPQLVYGNYTVKPQVVLEARSIPGSSKLVFTASAHHSITGGSLCLLDRTRGTEGLDPLTRLTPEVCFPETEGWPEHYYAHPWPLSEEYFLVGWADAKLPPHRFVDDHHNPPNAMGIYLYDAFGNLELLYRDPAISSVTPLPVAPRVKPPTQAPLVEWNGKQEGRFLVQDVYRGLDGVKRGAVKRLRVVGMPPKVQPHMNTPVLGVSAEDPGKFVLGTVPVQADGSAYFRVPSGVPVFFQALDEQGLAVQTMRSLTYVMPGQTLSCVGCHEHRDAAPSAGQAALAVRREASKLAPGPSGSWPLRFDELVQPVLDRQCVSCHRPGSEDVEAAKLDLTATNAWRALVSFGGEDLKKLAFERDRSIVGQGVAAHSRLWKLLTAPAGHRGVTLDADARNRLATWMDTYAHRQGHFSETQARELAALKARLADMLSPDPDTR